MNRLFDKIPEELFLPLSRKYKAVYSFALISLYHMLKLYHTDIKKTDYVTFLKSQGGEIMNLFSVEKDRLDDRDESERVEFSQTSDPDDEYAVLSDKVNYIIRKLAKCGWFIISKDPKTNIDFIYIPAYSIQFIKLLNELTTDAGAYLPLVHQTYSELKLEDEKEDDYMYRSLINAKNNAESLEMSVTLLRQQILVFGNRLTNVLDPNVALKQHFDEYRVDVAERYYHPMKTFDSLGLYSQPTIAILNRWLHSERILTMIVKEAKAEPQNRKRDVASLTSEVIALIQGIIDTFSKLSSQFNEIDAANANYTEAVQKKVNYLSSTDKTVKGKIDSIILALAKEIKSNPALRYDELPILAKASESVMLYRQGYLDSYSMTMPFKRGQREEMPDPLPLDDALFPEEQAMLMTNALQSEVDRFSDRAVEDFLNQNMQDRTEILTNELSIQSTDELVLMVFAILKSMIGVLPFTATKVQDKIEYAGYYMPLYKLTRKGGKKNVSRRV